MEILRILHESDPAIRFLQISFEDRVLYSRVFLLNAGPPEDPAHRLLAWIIRDVTEITTAQHQIVEKEDRLRSIFENALDAIAVNLLEDGTYLDVNPEFVRLSGYRREEIIGRTPVELRLWASEKELRTAVRKLRADGAFRNLQVHIRTRDGAILSTLLSAVTVPNLGRTAVVSFTRDVTVEIRLERELRELEIRSRERRRMAELGAVVARVLHDVRSPLSGILMSSRAIQKHLDGQPSPIATDVENITLGVHRLERLLSGVGNFVRRKRLEPRRFDVGELLLSVITLAAPQAREHGIQLSSNVSPRLSLYADESELQRVLENLTQNALDAIGEGPGEVRLEATNPAPDLVRITVRDSGRGVPEGIDPFALFDTTKKDGVGLGLAISREIAEAHGGTLRFERLEPRGTAFHFEIPIPTRTAMESAQGT